MDELAFHHVYGESLVQCNEDLLQLEKTTQIPQIEVRSDLLYRIDKGREDQKAISQLLVPQTYQNQLAHDKPCVDILGVIKWRHAWQRDFIGQGYTRKSGSIETPA